MGSFQTIGTHAMLEFFRKYQRYFFIFIAVVIVISFSFFGTHTTLNAPQKIEDRCIGQKIDGSKLMRSDLQKMTLFISSDRNDLALGERNRMPNFFNDGVIRKDLLGTGIGTLLVQAYFEELRDELAEKMNRHKEYRPYSHPSAPFISMENLWSQVLPPQKVNLDRFLKDTHEMNSEAFSLLVELYLGESAFPPNILREYLLYQQKHYSWIEPDPALQRANLSLFNCHSIEDWFGSRFVELVAQFVLNAETIARGRGYKVSEEEARVDLIRNGYEALQGQMRNKEVSQDDVSELWQQQLRYLGMNEKEAVAVWQKVMLFRRLFEDVGGAVFVDPQIYQTFYGFASKTAEVDLYHLPESLNLKDFSSLMKLELYLDQVAKNRKEVLLLPRSFSAAEEVEKTCPELVEERFLVEVAQINISDVALNVSVKETWEWQLEKDNYELLEKAFPQLTLKDGSDAEGYFAALEALPYAMRQKVDAFSRKKIVERHPEWITDALNQAHMKVKEVSYSPKSEETPFQGGEKLAKLLRAAALKGELEVNPDALKAREALEQFTADGETYFRFQVVDRDLERVILTFAEANERGILDRLLAKHLETAYPKVRGKNPALFKDDQGEWKPAEEVQSEIGKILYNDRLKKLEEEVVRLGCSKEENAQDAFYSQYRLLPYMRVAEKEIRKVGAESHFLKQSEASSSEGLSQKPSLEDQWSLIREHKRFKNHEKSPWFNSDIFSMVEKGWSNVAHRSGGNLSFFQLIEKTGPTGNFAEEMKEGQAILSREAERHLMGDLIEKMKAKEVVQFEHDNAQRS